jgi:small GTP-binding protein domain/small GTP-binding protein domain
MEKIVITGRANVGKSTLFNKISKRRISIVENIPGITTHVIESKAVFQDKVFKLVDTGGLTDSKEEISQAIRDKVLKLYKEAYKIIFVVDGKAGLMPEDKDIAKLLYPYKEKVYVAVNKTDSKKASASEFYELGFDNVFEISATHGTGVFELLEEITKDLPSMEEIEEKADFVKLSFIGKPNSGKETRLNSILKQDRVIVSNIAGTTRDAVDVEFSYEGKDFILVDTAGIRRLQI